MHRWCPTPWGPSLPLPQQLGLQLEEQALERQLPWAAQLPLPLAQAAATPDQQVPSSIT